MPFQNQWPRVRRTLVLPDASRQKGVTVTILKDDVQLDRLWTFRPSQHTVFVFLTDTLSFFELQIENDVVARELPVAGGVWSIPAGSRCHARLQGEAPTICEIAVPETAPNSLRREMVTTHNVSDGLLYQAALRFTELVGAQGEVPRLLLDCLAGAVQSHIIEYYCHDVSAVSNASRDPPLNTKTRTVLETYIRDHLADRLTLDDLAGLAGLSTHNLLKRFRASFGTTPAQYIINQRVAHAQLLLQRPSLQITDVALATGFYSPSHFSTVFSRYMGITPSAYRREFCFSSDERNKLS